MNVLELIKKRYTKLVVVYVHVQIVECQHLPSFYR